MTPQISMDTSAFSRAADSYKAAHETISKSMGHLAAGLDAHWGCAGTDPSAAHWASTYDPAAASALSAGTDLANSYSALHDLLAFTGVNHTNAERAAASPPLPPVPPPSLLERFTSPRFRGAFGGHHPAPFGWSAITSVAVDLVWPNGEPDDLHALSKAWQTAASELRAVVDGLGTSWGELEALSSPEVPQALAQLDVVFTFAEDLAQLFDDLAGACRGWAWDIGQAHRDIERIIAEAVAAAVIVGVVAACLTAGFATAAVESGIAGATTISVGAVLVTLNGAAIAGAAAAAGVGAAAVGAARTVQPLLEAQPTTFEAVPTGRGRTLQYHPAPDYLKAFPDTREAKLLSGRARWTDSKGRILEWDYQHGRIEMYGKDGKHRGEFDPDTGAQTKGADPRRRVAR